MDTYRTIQILQELVNAKNSELLQLNSYLAEAQNSSWNNTVTQQEYQNVVNEKDMAWMRVNDLQNQLTSLQQNMTFLTTSTTTSAELEATNTLLAAVKSERDFLQSVLATKENDIVNITTEKESIQAILNESQKTLADLNIISAEYNNKIAELGADLSKAIQENKSLQTEITNLEQKLETIKNKIRAEVEEATNEIEEVLDEAELTAHVNQ